MAPAEKPAKIEKPEKAAAEKPAKKSKPADVPEQFRGVKRYRLTKDAYVKGLRKAGEIITVTDTVPSKTWVEVDNAGRPVERDETEE